MFADEAIATLTPAWQRNLNSPFNLLDSWQNTVDVAKRGYTMSIYEFDNDISVRGAIQKILDNHSLRKYAEFADFAERVDKIDGEMRALFAFGAERHDRQTWWEKGILANGEDEYAQDVLHHYGYRAIPTR